MVNPEAPRVDQLRDGFGQARPQVGEPTYAHKLTADDRRLDWTRSAIELQRRVRVGGAWTTFRGRRLKVGRVALVDGTDGAPLGVSLAPGEIADRYVGTGDGLLELLEVQPEGKGQQPAAAWRNGARPTPDDRLGE